MKFRCVICVCAVFFFLCVASKKNKPIIIVYNSQRKEKNWLPTYMSDYEDEAHPFWTTNDKDKKVGDYSYIKEVLGF